jgi:hypothetical protein
MVLGTIALGVSASCAGELEGDEASYRAQHEPGCNVIPIFAQRCANSVCHGGSLPQEGLDLGSEGVRKRLLGVMAKGKGCESRVLIDPSDVDKSYVLEKIESTAPECGVQMPLTGRLTDTEKACIRTWATALAGGPSKHDSGPSTGPDSGGGAPDSSTPLTDSGATQ